MTKISENLRLLMLISKAEAVISRKFQSQGLSLADVMVLHAISGAPEERMRCVDLAEEAGLTASGVTRLLRPLEKFGVVKRTTNEFDARSSYLALTPSGKTTLKDAINILEDQCADLIPKNNGKAMQEICQLLQAIAK
jgi:DNA-binding MarR family transcriptional regulator